jgi:hypothetical protein
MAYLRKWSLLADAVKLVMASGSSRSQAKRDIVAALVDRSICLNPTAPVDLVYPRYLLATVQAPSDLTSSGIDWARSRPRTMAYRIWPPSAHREDRTFNQGRS